MDRSPALTLRPAQAHDAIPIAAMSRALIETGLAWRYTPRRIAAMIAGSETIALVADDGPRIGGFAVMQFGEEHGHLVLLCVAPPMQRRGVASALVDWLLKSARVAGLQTIAVELRTDNRGALGFYRSLGFIEDGLLADYYAPGIGARKMVLRLRDGAAC